VAGCSVGGGVPATGGGGGGARKKLGGWLDGAMQVRAEIVFVAVAVAILVFGVAVALILSGVEWQWYQSIERGSAVILRGDIW
jgi:hypothetical protein